MFLYTSLPLERLPTASHWADESFSDSVCVHSVLFEVVWGGEGHFTVLFGTSQPFIPVSNFNVLVLVILPGEESSAILLWAKKTFVQCLHVLAQALKVFKSGTTLGKGTDFQ